MHDREQRHLLSKTARNPGGTRTCAAHLVQLDERKVPSRDGLDAEGLGKLRRHFRPRKFSRRICALGDGFHAQAGNVCQQLVGRRGVAHEQQLYAIKLWPETRSVRGERRGLRGCRRDAGGARRVTGGYRHFSTRLGCHDGRAGCWPVVMCFRLAYSVFTTSVCVRCVGITKDSASCPSGVLLVFLS